jgi:hypothetical protein
MRVTYKGACHVAVAARDPLPEPYQKIWLTAAGLTVGEKGRHEFGLYDLSGHRVWRAHGTGAEAYRFADIRSRAHLPAGIYQARVTTAVGGFTRQVSLF